jgi:chromatin remodeling complex protein RSC6
MVLMDLLRQEDEDVSAGVRRLWRRSLGGAGEGFAGKLRFIANDNHSHYKGQRGDALPQRRQQALPQEARLPRDTRPARRAYARALSVARTTSTMATEANKTSAFMKALKPSPALAAIVGSEPLPRTAVTKALWDYIKAHNLQNPANKRNILCDAKLKAVMGKDEVTMFEMTGLVGKHLS